MSKLTKITQTMLLVAMTFGVLLQIRPGILRSATAIEAATAQAPNAQPTHDQLHQLLLERKRILEELTEDAKRNLEAGRLGIVEYALAKTASLTAGIDLCETKDERVKIYAEIVKVHEQSEAWTKRSFEHGRAGQVDLAKAKVARIESEIDLLREQLR